MKTWLITGCSTGFGRELSKYVLEQGHQVIVTARNPNQIEDIVSTYPKTARAFQLDVTVPEQIQAATEFAISEFGTIDVLVNNAGIGYFAAVEESEEEEVRKMFEINVFGLGNMTKAVLPQMRKQGSGHILNIASIGGLMSFPAVGYYNATKFAVDGLSEALYKEVSPLGIQVTIICPSGFRTDWAGRSANESNITIDDYAETAGANRAGIRERSGQQAGDPKRAAKAMFDVVESEQPPLRLLLGEAALKNGILKTEQLREEFEQYAEVSKWADNS